MKMKMLPIQLEPIVNWIQIKSMKMIYIFKNIMIQELHHSVEFRSCEVMKMKTHPIQFESIMFVIRMWLSQFLDFHTKTLPPKRELICPPPRRTAILRVQNHDLLNWIILHNRSSHSTHLHSNACGCASWDLHSQTDNETLLGKFKWIEGNWNRNPSSSSEIWNAFQERFHL
jgi:hypothetical protein